MPDCTLLKGHVEIEEIVPRDRRSSSMFCSDIGELIEANEATEFVSIPEGMDGSVLIEYDHAAKRIVSL